MNRLRIKVLSILYRNWSSTSVTKKNNHYESLEISPEATHNEIKSAYFKLSKKYHPDMNKSQEAKEKFSDITEAYETLGNHGRRQKYDRGLSISPVHEEYHMKPKEEFKDVNAEARRVQEAYNLHRDVHYPVYNFDKWNEKHYGRVFEKRKREILKSQYLSNRRLEHLKINEQDKKELPVFIIVSFIILWSMFGFLHIYKNRDIPMTIIDNKQLNENQKKNEDSIKS